MSTHRAPRDSALSGVLSVLGTTLLLAVLALVAVVVVPRAVDGAALTVLTGSMEPTFSPGDVVVIRGVDDAAREVQIGDAVTFQPVSDDPALVTHRVVGKSFSSSGTTFTTRGDANGADDDPIAPAQIKGKVMFSVPWVGHVSLWLGEHRGLAVTGAAVALLAYATFMILRPDRDRRAAASAAPAGDTGTQDTAHAAVQGDPVPTVTAQAPAAREVIAP